MSAPRTGEGYVPSPFSWHGNKYRWASIVWPRLGDPDVYAEPFAGTLALLLARPGTNRKREIIVDKDAYVTNFWRAAKWSPSALAESVQWPVNMIDLNARNAYLTEWAKTARDKMREDPRWHDPEAAGWWAWGTYHTVKGWTRRSNFGTPYICGGFTQPWTSRDFSLRGTPSAYFDWLSRRLSETFVLAGDWRKAVTPAMLSYHPKARTPPTIAVTLDPPYRSEDRTIFYNEDSDSIAGDAYRWAIEHGDIYRIAYFSTVGDLPIPEGWTQATLPRKGTARESKGERRLDACYFSPACIDPQPSLFA